MIVELDTDILDKVGDLTLGQLVFITLVLDENQNNHQDVSQLISLVSDDDIQALVNRDLLTIEECADSKVYKHTQKLTDLLSFSKSMFDEFYEEFPAIVYRPDGLRSFLRTNMNRCRKLYGQIVGKSRAKHEHIMECLREEIRQKHMTNKMGYMKTMWRWLTNNEWEMIEEQVKYKDVINPNENSYGTDIL